MSYELKGTIVQIEQTVQVNDKFRKREFVLEFMDNNYTNYAKFQTVQAKCDLLDRYAVGEDVTVSFNVKGNKWEKDGKVNYITNLDAWKIASAAGNVPTQTAGNVPNNNVPAPENVPSGGAVDDLPF
jgi:hypothetical protein